MMIIIMVMKMTKEGNKKENWQNITFSLILTGFAGVGFLINKFYLAVQYSFDTTSEVSFVPIDEIPDRFLTSIRLMLEFMGYRQIQVVICAIYRYTIPGMSVGVALFLSCYDKSRHSHFFEYPFGGQADTITFRSAIDQSTICIAALILFHTVVYPVCQILIDISFPAFFVPVTYVHHQSAY